MLIKILILKLSQQVLKILVLKKISNTLIQNINLKMSGNFCFLIKLIII